MTRMDRRSRPQSIDRWIESANQKQVRQGSYARTARAEGWHTQAARSKKQKPFHIGVHAADPLLERPASIRLRTQASAGRLPSRSRVLPCLLFPAQTHLLLPFPVALRLQCRTCTVWVCRCISPFLRAVPVHLLQPMQWNLAMEPAACLLGLHAHAWAVVAMAAGRLAPGSVATPFLRAVL
jgi:hypothetical protein